MLRRAAGVTVAMTAALASLLSGPSEIHAQEFVWSASHGVPTGSEFEDYLRLLQATGNAPWTSWTIRALTPRELEDIASVSGTHPWASWIEVDVEDGERPAVDWIPFDSGLHFNSGFPFGDNDGSLWAGRGLSLRASGGFVFRWGGLHVRAAPEVWWAQNLPFGLTPNGLSDGGAFRDPVRPGSIDLPQRFGSASLGGISPGSSQITLSLPLLTLGVSGAAQTWGPGTRYHLLMGPNAGGMPHLFASTSGPLDIGIGRLSARLILGRLGQSAWSPVQEGQTRRFLSGAVVTFAPDLIRGLELGVERVVHGIWPEGGPGLGEILRPFSSGVSTGYVDDPLGGTNRLEENQLAGAFARWLHRDSGLEVWVELIRDDFARDIRHYLLEPDDLLARSLGIQRVMELSDNRWMTLRGEVVSAETHHSEREDRSYRRPGVGAPPIPIFPNGGVRQGHTLDGQLLASPAVYGGSAWTLGADLHSESGRWSIDLFQELRRDWSQTLSGGEGDLADVIYGVRMEWVLFRQRQQLSMSLTPALNLNRNLRPGNDVLNVGAALSARGLPW